MQEMLSVVFAILPEDPFEYMNLHIATHRPAPPPQQYDNLCGSAALWVLLPGGEPLCAEHWRLRRCWLTQQGYFCVSNATSQVTKSGDGLMISPPTDDAPRNIGLATGTTFMHLNEDEAARPFAFKVVPGNAPSSAGFVFAAGSAEQRDEWRLLFSHFADPIKNKGPPPRSPRSLSPRMVESKVPNGTFTTPLKVDAGASSGMQFMEVTAAPVATTQPNVPRAAAHRPPMSPPGRPIVVETPMPGSPPPRKPMVNAMEVPSTGTDTRQRMPLKPILKTRAIEQNPGKVPAIRIPHTASADVMEAISSGSNRGVSVRFDDQVVKHEIPQWGRAQPVPNRNDKGAQAKPKAPVVVPPGPPVEAPTPVPKAEPAKDFAPPPRSPRPQGGTAVADAVQLTDVPQGLKSLPPPAYEKDSKASPKSPVPALQLSRDAAIEAASRVLLDAAGPAPSDRTGSKGSATSGRQELVKGILESLVDQLEGGDSLQDASFAESASSIDDRKVESAKSVASLASSDAREVFVSDLVHGVTRDILADSNAFSEQDDLAARVVTSELARPDDRVSQVLSARQAATQTEEVSDDMFNNLVGDVISDLFAGEPPATREQLTARVASARSTTSARSGAASEGAYDLVAQMIGDALDRPFAASLPLNVDLPVDVPAGTAVADAVDFLAGVQEPERPATGGPAAASSTKGFYSENAQSQGEVYGDIAADMLDQMMLEPILQLIEEPVDPAVVLLGDALPPLYSARSNWSATSSDLREELALRALDEMMGGTGVADSIDVTEDRPSTPPKPPAGRHAEESGPPPLPGKEVPPEAPPLPAKSLPPSFEVPAEAAKEVPFQVHELFFALPYKEDPAFHAAVKEELRNHYVKKGISDPTLKQVRIDLREGSTIVTHTGPPFAIAELRKVDVSDLTLMGHPAKRTAEELKVPQVVMTHSTQLAPVDSNPNTARSIGMVSQISATLSEAFHDHAISLVSDVLEESARTAEAEAKERAEAAERMRQQMEAAKEEAERRKVAEAAARKEAEAKLKEAQKRAAEADEAARKGALAEDAEKSEAERRIREAEMKRESSKQAALAKLEEAKRKAAEAEEARLKALAEEEAANRKAVEAQAAKERAKQAEEARQRNAAAEEARRKAEEAEAKEKAEKARLMRLELEKAKEEYEDSLSNGCVSVRSSELHEDTAAGLVGDIVEDGCNRAAELQETEAARKAEDDGRLAAEQQARLKALALEEENRQEAAREEEAGRKAEAERLAKEQAGRDAEAARKAKEESDRLKALTEEATRNADAAELARLEAAGKKAADEEAARKKAAGEEQKARESAEAEAQSKAAEEEARRKAEAEAEQARLRAVAELQGSFKLFFDLPSNKVDSDTFKSELTTGFKNLGATDAVVATVTISIRNSNTMAEISGPHTAFTELQKLPLTSLTVGGSLARLRQEDVASGKLPQASPEVRAASTIPDTGRSAGMASVASDVASSAAISQMQYELASDMIHYLVENKISQESIQADIAAAAAAAAAMQQPLSSRTDVSISRLSDQETEANALAQQLMGQLVLGSERPEPHHGPAPASISHISEHDSQEGEARDVAQNLMQQVDASRPSSAGGISRMSDGESEHAGLAQNLMEELVMGSGKPVPHHGPPPVDSAPSDFGCSDVSRDNVEEGIADRLVHGLIKGYPGDQALAEAAQAQARAQEEEARRKAEEARIFNEEVKRKAAEEEARKKTAEEEARRKAKAEQDRLQALAMQAELEQARLKEEARLLEQQRLADEVAGRRSGSNTARSRVSSLYDGSACGSALSSELEGHMATVMVAKLLEQRANSLSAVGTAVADAIEVNVGSLKPVVTEAGHELFELFFAAPFTKIDHDAFKAGIKDGLKGLGASDPSIASLRVDLRAGSTIAELRGPPPCITDLKGLDISKLNVMGYFAKLSAAELKAAEEEDARQSAAREEEARRKNVEEQLRLEAIALEAEMKQKKAEEEQARLEAEGKAAEAERARAEAAEAQAKLQSEADVAEAARRKAAEEEAREKAFTAEKARQNAAEEAARLALAKQRAAEEEDAAKKKVAEEEAKVQEAAAAEALHKAKEEADKLFQFAAEEARQRANAEQPLTARSAGSSLLSQWILKLLKGRLLATFSTG
jgi:hypothetical protein